ncbi:MAG: hypothetical protein FJ088_00125, partial [Deltaproteobacteria bacterium]|nr:hypothetical protein [Deltaproteobacteria bacterium]
MREMDNSVIVTVQNSFPPLIANGFKRGRDADKPLHAGCFFLNSFHSTIRLLAAAADSCGSNFFENEWTGLRRIEQYIDIINRQEDNAGSREPFDKIIPLFREKGDFRKSLDTLTG